MNRCLLHRVKSVQDKIKKDLLKLHTIAFDRYELWVEVCDHGTGAIDCIGLRQCNDCLHYLIHVDRLPPGFAFLYHFSDAADNFTCSFRIGDDITQKFTEFFSVGDAVIQKPLARSGGAG
jgi:hypothetical protein